MKNILTNLYEHIITKRKYNKLLLANEILREDNERLTIEKKQQKNTFELEKEVLEQEITELQQEIIKLRKKKASK